MAKARRTWKEVLYNAREKVLGLYFHTKCLSLQIYVYIYIYIYIFMVSTVFDFVDIRSKVGRLNVTYIWPGSISHSRTMKFAAEGKHSRQIRSNGQLQT